MHNPFVGPHPLTKDDPIFGRDREIAELRHLITAERVVLLCSPSGAGKSSLIHAGLIPELDNRFDVWKPTRVNTEPPPNTPNRYVWSAINGWQLEGLETTLSAFVAARPRRGNVLLIFDQFEEILRTNPADAGGQGEFFRQLAELLHNPQIWALFVIREDYLAPLLPFAAMLPTRLRTRYRLDFLAKKEANAAMSETAESGGRQFRPEALETLFNNLAAMKVQNLDGSYAAEPVIGNYVEPMQLQIVCHRLWEAMPKTEEYIGPEDIRDFGDVTEALGSYYDSSVKDDRIVREWFQEKLIKSRVRSQVQMGDQVSEGLSNKIIEKLLDTHLIRGEKRRGVTWFELAHDRLIDPVLRSNEKWFLANLNPTQQRAALWLKQEKIGGLLLPAADLPAAVAWLAENQATATSAEREFVAESQEKEAAEEAKRQAAIREAEHKRLLTRSLWRVRAFLAAAVVCLAVAGWQWMVANAQREEAKKQERNAKIALSRGSVVEAGKAIYLLQDDLGLAHYARALRLDPGSLSARVGIASLLQQRHWRVRLQPPLMRRYEFEAPELGVSLSADGKRIMTAARNETAQLWDGLTGLPLRKPIVNNEGGGATAALSADGRRMVTAPEEDTAQVWDAANGMAVGNPLVHQGKLRSAALNADGRLLVTVTESGAQIWDVETGRPAGETAVRQGSFNRAEFSADGTRVLTVSGRSAQVWNTAGWKAVGNPIVRQETLNGAFLSIDGRRVVTLTGSTAALWDASTGAPVGNPMIAAKNIASAVFTRDGRLFTVCGGEGGFQVWDAATGDPVGKSLVQPEWQRAEAAVFSADARILVTTRINGETQVSRVIGMPLPGKALVHRSRVAGVGFSPDGARAITASEMSVHVWDVASRTEQGTPLALGAEVNRAEFSGDGNRILTISGGKKFQTWDAATRRQHGQGFLANDVFGRVVVGSVELSGGQQLMMTVSDRSNIPQVRDVASGEPWGMPLADQLTITSRIARVAFSADGKRVLIEVEFGDQVRVYDVASGKALGSVFGRSVEEVIGGAAISADGQMFVTASGRIAQLRHAGNGVTLGKPLVHKSRVFSSAFSADSRLLVTAQADGTVQIWDAATGEALGVPLVHKSAASGMAFSGDGRRLITATEETVQIWDVLVDAGTAEDAQLLAEFAESIAGVAINEFGSPVAIAGQGARRQALLAKANQRPGMLLQFIHRFLGE